MTERTRLVRVSGDLLAMLGTRSFDGRALSSEWGEPVGHCPDSDEYIYEPTITATEDGTRFVTRDTLAEALYRSQHDRLYGGFEGGPLGTHDADAAAILAHLTAPHTASGTSARPPRAEGPGRHPRQEPSPLEPAGEPDPETRP